MNSRSGGVGELGERASYPLHSGRRARRPPLDLRRESLILFCRES